MIKMIMKTDMKLKVLAAQRFSNGKKEKHKENLKKKKNHYSEEKDVHLPRDRLLLGVPICILSSSV